MCVRHVFLADGGPPGAVGALRAGCARFFQPDRGSGLVRGGNAGACERIGAAGREYIEEDRFMDAEADLAMGVAVAAAAVSRQDV